MTLKRALPNIHRDIRQEVGSGVYDTPVEQQLHGVWYIAERWLCGVSYTAKWGLRGVSYTEEKMAKNSFALVSYFWTLFKSNQNSEK